MKKKILFALIAVLGVELCFAQVNLKIATIAPARSVWDNELKKLAMDWSKITNGDVKMQFMNATAMGGETGVIQKLNSVRPGQKAPIDGAIFTNLGIGELVPNAKILTLCVPFLFRNQEEVDLVYKEFEPRLQSELKKQGYVFLGTFVVGWAYFYTKQPARTPKELKSQKLYVGGLGLATLTDSFKAVGFQTIDISSEKLLQSFKTPGGAEGFYTIPMYAYAGQYYKSLPYILNAPICPVLATFIINEKTWNSFSDERKKTLLESVAVVEKNFIQEQKNSDQEYLDLCVKGGCTLVNLTPEEYKVMEDTLGQDAYIMAKTGLMDADFLAQIQATLKKYRGE